MIVAVDARHLAGGRGVAHYTSALLAALTAAFPGDELRPVAPPRARRLAFGAAAVLGRPRTGRGADVLWIPAPAPIAVPRDLPYVLTVHDLSWIDRPEDFTPYERVWHRLARIGRLAERAAAVVCDSAATRERALAEWRLDAARTHVVHAGVTALPVDGPSPVAAPYFVAVGALEPRKAPVLLADAHALARADGLRAELVFAGTGRLAEELTGRDGVHVLGRVDDLGPLYRDALALVMPSYLEGFGFPPLEAALAGTPSIVADLPVYDETLGDGAVRFPAGDVRALAGALLAVERDPPPAPRERAAALTWERAARALHPILAEAAAR